MSWRDIVGKGIASFRGVKFYVDTSEYQSGRRLVKNEYPYRDDVYPDDLGRKARGFPVEGHVIGDDYIAQRDALITALETSGSGPLVHPFHGKRTVVVEGFSVRETSAQGGTAEFRIEFGEAQTPDKLLPTVQVDTGSALTSAVAAGRAAVLAAFLQGYIVTGTSYLSTVQSVVQRMADGVSAIVAKINLTADQAAAFDQTFVNLHDNIAGLVRTPQALYDSLSTLIEQTITLGSLGQVAYDLEFGPPPPTLTPERLQEYSNWTTVKTAFQRLVVLKMAEDAPQDTFTSYEEAVTARNMITALIDDQAENATDDTFPALTDVRTTLVQAVPGPDLDLPHLLTIVPAAPLPSILLAFQLYGALDLEQDLIDRNDIRDPAACFGTLQVLTNG